MGAARGAAARGASAGRGAAGPWIRGSALPAALAAAAEAGLGFLPAELVARHSALGPTGGLLAWYPAFAVLVAAGTAVATRARDRRFTPAGILAGVAVAAAVQATLWGRGGLGGALVAVGLFLAVGARMATLVFRDWRDPVDASIGWGAAALLGEVALAPAVGWGAELWPIVVVFFAGSLASRAASVRLAESAARTPSGSMGDRDPRAALVAADLPIDVRRRWTRVFAAVLVGAILLVGSGLFLGLPNGPIEPVANFLIVAIVWVLYGVAVALAILLWPLAWLLQVLGLNGDNIRRVLQNLRGRIGGAAGGGSARGVPAWQRPVGLVIVALILAALVMSVLRQRRKVKEAVADHTRWVEEETVSHRPGQTAFVKRRRRRELPEDAVRRLYAEALIELEKRGRPRPDSVTPGEFLQTIRRDLPECAAGFGVLTGAYEAVRYGLLELDSDRIGSLEAESLVLTRAIRRAPLPETAEGQDPEAERITAARRKGADRSAPSTYVTFRRR